MNIIRIITTVLSLLLAAAHYMRAGHTEITFLFASLSFLLLARKRWADLIPAVIISIMIPIWVHTALRIILIRRTADVPWQLAALIMGIVTLTALAAAILGFRHVRLEVKSGKKFGIPSFTSFLLTGGILMLARTKASLTILLPDRFLPGSGIVLIIILAGYAAWITEKYIRTDDTSILRRRIWLLFSIVFFSQAILGISGVENLLMTGKLHIPVPAVIIGGPIYRGGGFFMTILFTSTLILAGSAWCSHLCYFGAWDNLAAVQEKKTGSVTPFMKEGRYIFLFLTVITALLLRIFGAHGALAAATGITFGLGGAAVMLFVSRKRGVMAHCTSWCPLGLLANIGGKISPFRIRIEDSCNSCLACTVHCRYGALGKNEIAEKKPGLSCSLCGDCLSRCKEGALKYSFLKLSGEKSRILFIILVISVHASCLGLARI